MKAIKISASVGRDRRLVLQLPSETPEGGAEVIVLVPEGRAEPGHVEAFLARAAEWRAGHPEQRTKDAIDRELAEERAAWDGR